MPEYLGADVTEAFLELLIAGYIDGAAAGGRSVEDSAIVILEHLAANGIATAADAAILGMRDAEADEAPGGAPIDGGA